MPQAHPLQRVGLGLELTRENLPLQSVSSPGTPLLCPILHEKATTVSAPPDEFEQSRAEKLRRIKELGLDPWGGRFDNHQPIAAIRALPTDLPDDQRPKVRAAGRIKLRRTMGKVHFLTI